MPHQDKTHLRTLKRILGVFAIVLGIVGIIVPFAPGLIFLYVGLSLLGVRLAVWDHLRGWWRSRRLGVTHP